MAERSKPAWPGHSQTHAPWWGGGGGQQEGIGSSAYIWRKGSSSGALRRRGLKRQNSKSLASLGRKPGVPPSVAFEATQVAPIPANSPQRHDKNQHHCRQWGPPRAPQRPGPVPLPEAPLQPHLQRGPRVCGLGLGKCLSHSLRAVFISSPSSPRHFPEQDIKARKTEGFRGF